MKTGRWPYVKYGDSSPLLIPLKSLAFRLTEPVQRRSGLQVGIDVSSGTDGGDVAGGLQNGPPGTAEAAIRAESIWRACVPFPLSDEPKNHTLVVERGPVPLLWIASSPRTAIGQVAKEWPISFTPGNNCSTRFGKIAGDAEQARLWRLLSPRRLKAENSLPTGCREDQRRKLRGSKSVQGTAKAWIRIEHRLQHDRARRRGRRGPGNEIADSRGRPAWGGVPRSAGAD